MSEVLNWWNNINPLVGAAIVFTVYIVGLLAFGAIGRIVKHYKPPLQPEAER